MIKKQVVDHHGRVDNVKIFNCDPTPFIREAKAKEEARIKAEQEAERARLLAEENGELPEESKEPAAQPVQEEEEEEKKEPDYVQFEDDIVTLYDIFQHYGLATKAEVDEDPTCQKELFYDFTPFNSKDPVLLSLMTAKKYV